MMNVSVDVLFEKVFGNGGRLVVRDLELSAKDRIACGDASQQRVWDDTVHVDATSIHHWGQV